MNRGIKAAHDGVLNSGKYQSLMECTEADYSLVQYEMQLNNKNLKPHK